jgi:hypothetical protein
VWRRVDLVAAALAPSGVYVVHIPDLRRSPCPTNCANSALAAWPTSDDIVQSRQFSDVEIESGEFQLQISLKDY